MPQHLPVHPSRPSCPPEFLPSPFPPLCVNPTMSSSSAQIKSPGLRSAWHSPQNWGWKINLSAPKCFASVHWTPCILFERSLFLNYGKKKLESLCFLGYFLDFLCLFPSWHPFLPQSKALEKKKKVIRSLSMLWFLQCWIVSFKSCSML